ncbi:MAG TPA: hypothetical protein VGC79_34210 [Polyangiaceae bacterium]
MIRFLQLIAALLCMATGSDALAFQVKSTFVDVTTGKPVVGIEVSAEDIGGKALTEKRKTDSQGKWNPIISADVDEVVLVYASPFHGGDRVNASVRNGVADVGKVRLVQVVSLGRPVLTALANGGALARFTLSATANVSSERVVLRLQLPKTGACATENLPLTFELLRGAPEPLVKVSGADVTQRTLRAQARFEDCAGGSATISVDWLLPITATVETIEFVLPASFDLSNNGHTLRIGPWRPVPTGPTGEAKFPAALLSFGISKVGVSLFTDEAEGRVALRVK